MCSACIRTNFLTSVICRGEDCARHLNPHYDAYVNRWAIKDKWPAQYLANMGFRGPKCNGHAQAPPLPASASAAAAPIPKSGVKRELQEQQQQQQQQAGPLLKKKEPSLQQKLESAKHQLTVAQQQDWDAETTSYLQQRVEAYQKELASQQPAWQRLQQAKKSLKAAADRTETAVRLVEEWQQELHAARVTFRLLRKPQSEAQAQTPLHAEPLYQGQYQLQRQGARCRFPKPMRTLCTKARENRRGFSCIFFRM